MKRFIQIIGARTHNLKNISCTIPLGKITVITGISGSGKSSLAFNTLFAEGQRRYAESLSTYARQFLERVERPDVDFINNIPPAVAVEQQNKVRNARSTVGTASEINDYLQLLFATVGKTICPDCKIEVKRDTPHSVALQLAQISTDTKLTILAPLKRSDWTSVQSLKEELIRAGFFRIFCNGEVQDLSLLSDSDIEKQETILIVIDRLRFKPEEEERLIDSLQMAFQLGQGKVRVMVGEGKGYDFDSSFSCKPCRKSFRQKRWLLMV